MSYISNFFKGILIGAGAIFPGISSGVLCVIFGIYEKLVSSILHFFNDIKSNVKFLLPIALGILIGIVLLGNILQWLFQNYSIQTKFMFIGLIIGTIPVLIKQTIKEQIQFKYISFFFACFILSLLLTIAERYGYNIFKSNPTILYLVVCGFLMSIGVVVPGISSTIILMILGIYSTYLNAISCLNLAILIPIGIGLLIGGLLFIKIIELLFKKFYLQTYYSIIGFSCGSIFVLYEPIIFDLSGLFAILLLVLGFFVSYLFFSS